MAAAIRPTNIHDHYNYRYNKKFIKKKHGKMDKRNQSLIKRSNKKNHKITRYYLFNKKIFKQAYRVTFINKKICRELRFYGLV